MYNSKECFTQPFFNGFGRFGLFRILCYDFEYEYYINKY